MKRPKPAKSEHVEFRIDAGGDAPITVALELPTAPVPARRMLPVLQTLAHKVIDVAVDAATKGGEAVSCRAHCGACCRQLVPVSLTEARRIAELVQAMPPPKRARVRERFAKAVARLESSGLLDELREMDDTAGGTRSSLNPRYFPLGIACPFLEDESCSIHRDRPLICREYLVTSSPEHCADASSRLVRRIPVHNAVSVDACRLEYRGRTTSRIPLVLALAWAEEHTGDEPPPRPPIDWIQQLLGTDPDAIE